jgi:hypothetical protein
MQKNIKKLKMLEYKGINIPYCLISRIDYDLNVRKTYFFSPTPIIKKRKKWIIFGPIIEKQVHDLIHIVNYHINDINIKEDRFIKDLEKVLSIISKND